MQIVLARLDDDIEIVRARRTDLGERPITQIVKKPVSLMWTNNGTELDLAKARAFAQTEGYNVLCYENERQPLERARREIAA